MSAASFRADPNPVRMDSTGVTDLSAVVEYFTFNPVTEPKSVRPGDEVRQGYGTFDAQTGSTTPGFARITSTGTNAAVTDGSSKGRTLTSTYVFRTPRREHPGWAPANSPPPVQPRFAWTGDTDRAGGYSGSSCSHAVRAHLLRHNRYSPIVPT